MKPPWCPTCKYVLHGLDDTSRCCPECGKLVEMPDIAIRARQHPEPNYMHIFGVAVVVAVPSAVLVMGIAHSVGDTAALVLLFSITTVSILVTMLHARSVHRKRDRQLGKVWDLLFTAHNDGCRIESLPDDNATGDVSGDTDASFWFLWTDLQPIMLQSGRGRRVIIGLYSRRFPMKRWFELDCSYTYAHHIVEQLNWFRHACWRAKWNPVDS